MPAINFGIKKPADFVAIPDAILEKTIIPQFEHIAEKHPDRIAIKDKIHSINYRELNNAINDLAHQIILIMQEDRSPVAFLFNDEVFSIIAFMAIIKSGRPYIGLYPDTPNEQLKICLEHSTAPLLITATVLKDAAKNILPAVKSVTVLFFDEIKTDSNHQNPMVKISPNAPFSIFYTSGSTDKPKGVTSDHLHRAHAAQYMNNEWFISPSDRISLVTSVCFGAAYPSVLGALLSGALLWLFDLKANTAQAALDWLINDELTVFRCTPSIFRTIFGLAPNGLIFSKLRFITLGGEPVTDSDIELFKMHTAQDCVLINNFSATEAGSICHYPVHHNTPHFLGFLPAGYPAPGKEVMLVDDNGELVANGQEGEIIVRSRFLNPGYWNQPELTTQKFHADAHDPEFRIYYTGDRGRWRKDGALETSGRKDFQVKIRGYRVQLETVDSILRSLAGVRDAATIVHKSPSKGERLVAYLSMFDHTEFSAGQLRKQLFTLLPGYMIPSIFIQMDALPRTVTGKLARRELPEPSNQRPDLDTLYVPPEGRMQIQISLIWQKILGLETIGVNDNFFELGGDSLMALEMTLEIEKMLARAVPQVFFRNPTVSFLANAFESADAPQADTKKFTVVSTGKDGHQIPKLDKVRRFKKAKLYRILNGAYLSKLDKLIDRLVARYVVSKSYVSAREWAVKWSRNPIVRNVIYRSRYNLLARWMATLKDCQIQPSEAFQINIMTNMNFGLSRYLKSKEFNEKVEFQNYKRLRHRYWRTLGELLEAIPPGQLNENFPISGLEHFTQAYAQGKGVILLTFHGMPRPEGFFPLERYLRLEHIPTISYHIPRRQNRYNKKENKLSEVGAASMNAEIAQFGQSKLLAGKVINIVSDTNDKQGRTHQVVVAGRIFHIKAGFAELALNTGARIIPHFRHCLPDGRIQLSFGAPLESGSGERYQQVENLLNEYASFIENTWSTHPEALSWAKIRRHLLSRPSVEHNN